MIITYSIKIKFKRLNKKPLLVIDGLPIIIHTLKEFSSVKVDKVIVCTDSREIKELLKIMAAKLV